MAAARWASQNRLDRKNLHVDRISKIIAEELRVDVSALTDGASALNLPEVYRKASALVHAA